MRIVGLGPPLDQWFCSTTATRRGLEQLLEAAANAPLHRLLSAHRTLRTRVSVRLISVKHRSLAPIVLWQRARASV
jgi:hypothetical protein